MKEEVELDLRRTQLLAVGASLADARRALMRAARIHSTFAMEVRALLGYAYFAVGAGDGYPDPTQQWTD